jgi:heat shock protein HtpX
MKNIMKTYLFLGGLTALLLIIGNMLGGSAGILFALILSLFMNFFAYWFSDKIVLSMYGAKEVFHGHPTKVYEMVEQLARRAGIPMPRVYVIDSDQPNAFATGRNPEHSAIATTIGLLNSLSFEEIEAVIAHEISHIKNRDILISSLAAVVASAIMHLASIAQWAMIFGGGRSGDDDDNGGGILRTIVMIVFAPIAAMLIHSAISRSREYMADKGSKILIGSGVPLASALKKIEAISTRSKVIDVKPETAHMFIYSPLSGKSLFSLFSTHPATEERVKKLLYGE